MVDSIEAVKTPYEDLLREVFNDGAPKGDRTGTGTRSVFGRQIKYDLSEGFPLITTKKVSFRLIATELLWLLSGDTNIRPLLLQKNPIWTEWPFKNYLKKVGKPIPEQDSEEWTQQIKEFEQQVVNDEDFAREYGDLGPVYGKQWREWLGADGVPIDQIATVIEQLKTDPDSRRIIVSAWNVTDLPQMALSPCHAFFQFYVANGKLSCMLTQRSSDMFLGVPFNIASYSLLTHMIADQLGLEVGEFTWSSGDTHIYDNLVEQVEVQLSREARPLPQLKINRTPESIFDYKLEDFEVVGYNPHPVIRGMVAV